MYFWKHSASTNQNRNGRRENKGGESGPVVAGICHLLFLLGFGIEDGKVGRFVEERKRAPPIIFG